MGQEEHQKRESEKKKAGKERKKKKKKRESAKEQRDWICISIFIYAARNQVRELAVQGASRKRRKCRAEAGKASRGLVPRRDEAEVRKTGDQETGDQKRAARRRAWRY